MGEGILRFYQTRVKEEHKVAFMSTFFFTLLIHLYKFTNTLPNHDSVYNYYSDQNVLGSGRWALSLACGISSYFDLPWIIGVLSCVFIALTVVVIVALFKLKNPVLIGLTGILLAAAPSTTETFFFLFTADGYMIAMFLAALATYFSRIDENRVSRWIFSGICICSSCGIYQAYVSFALILAVCYFMDDLLQGNHEKQDYFSWVWRQVIIYSVSLAAYYVIWKLCMHFSGTTVNDNQGISEVGKIRVGLLLGGVIRAVKTVILYFLQWDVIAHGFTLYSALSIVFLLVMSVGIIVAYLKSKVFRRKWALALFVLCLIAIIPFACIWHFISDAVGYRPMMLQCMTLLFVLTAILYERWAGPVVKNTAGLFLLVVALNNALMANISYFYMNQCYERTYAEGVEMMMEIHDLQDEYEFDKIAVLGNRIYEVQHENVDPATGETRVPGKIQLLIGGLEQTLLFDSDHTIQFLKATFGLNLESLNRSQRAALMSTEQVQTMGCWPEGNSMAVIDDTLVIKLSGRNESE